MWGLAFLFTMLGTNFIYNQNSSSSYTLNLQSDLTKVSEGLLLLIISFVYLIVNQIGKKNICDLQNRVQIIKCKKIKNILVFIIMLLSLQPQNTRKC